jgi:hypothetical protein
MFFFDKNNGGYSVSQNNVFRYFFNLKKVVKAVAFKPLNNHPLPAGLPTTSSTLSPIQY